TDPAFGTVHDSRTRNGESCSVRVGRGTCCGDAVSGPESVDEPTHPDAASNAITATVSEAIQLRADNALARSVSRGPCLRENGVSAIGAFLVVRRGQIS